MKCGFVVLISISVIVAFIIIISCVVSSIYHIPPNNIGLFEHKWTKALSEEPYPPGTYIMPPMNKLKLFPTTYITHSFYGDEYNVNTRTKDGLELALNVEVYSKIIPEYIRDIYLTYGDNYNDFIRMKIKSDIRNVGGTYKAEFYQTNFTDISNAIVDKLEKSLKELHYELGRICITSYDLPNEYEDILLNIAVADQDKDIAVERLTTEKTALDVELSKADKEAEINVYYEKGLLNNTKIEEFNRLDAKNNTLAIEARSIAMILEKNGGSTDDTGSSQTDTCTTSNKYGVCFEELDYYLKILLYNEIYRNNVPVHSANNVYYRS